MNTEEYSHTQQGWITLLSVVAAMVVDYLVLDTKKAASVAFFITLVALLVAVAKFSTLTVTGNSTRLRISFGLGLIHKTFRYSEISSCRVVSTPWYFGWGIRAIPGGWLFNVSGLRSVELQMNNRRVYRIGSDEPEKLEAFLKPKLAAA